tara:strand:- start:15 stop:734 length:720 start_codon:yes stop_codon:yes gene_type:complete
MKNILILIFSCKIYKHRIDNLEKIGYFNYLDQNNANYFIVTGDTSIDNEYEIDNKNFIINIGDTYDQLPIKVLKAFILAQYLFDCDLILKIDDDCLINLDKFYNNIDYFLENNYVGCLSNCNYFYYNPHWNGLNNSLSKYHGPYMGGGTAYVITKKIIDDLCDNYDIVSKLLDIELYEDKLIGDSIRLLNYNINFHSIWNKKKKNIKYLKLRVKNSYDSNFFKDYMIINDIFNKHYKYI